MFETELVSIKGVEPEDKVLEQLEDKASAPQPTPEVEPVPTAEHPEVPETATEVKDEL